MAIGFLGDFLGGFLGGAFERLLGDSFAAFGRRDRLLCRFGSLWPRSLKGLLNIGN
jgi:hypothetical protein